MVQDEGHTKDEVASIGPYTNYLTLLFVITIHYMVRDDYDVRSLRSEGKNLLVVPNIKSANGRRSFSFAAPMIWNSLPEHIRNSCSLTIFRNTQNSSFPPLKLLVRTAND